jgi:hypothetical protein
MSTYTQILHQNWVHLFYLTQISLKMISSSSFYYSHSPIITNSIYSEDIRLIYLKGFCLN